MQSLPLSCHAASLFSCHAAYIFLLLCRIYFFSPAMRPLSNSCCAASLFFLYRISFSLALQRPSFFRYAASLFFLLAFSLSFSRHAASLLLLPVASVFLCYAENLFLLTSNLAMQNMFSLPMQHFSFSFHTASPILSLAMSSLFLSIAIQYISFFCHATSLFLLPCRLFPSQAMKHLSFFVDESMTEIPRPSILCLLYNFYFVHFLSYCESELTKSGCFLCVY
jgi:hypothetical protein